MLKKLFYSVSIIALLAVVYIFVSAVQAAPGDLDLTFAGFGSSGIVNQGRSINRQGMAVQPDGKIVTLGSPNGYDLTVYRYLPNGQPDPTFDGDGVITHENMFAPASVAIQSDGRIVVGGSRDFDNFYLARLTTTGALDSSFDGDGLVEDIDPELSSLESVLVQFDGKIVACGMGLVGGDKDFVVTRYTTTGARDNFFSNDGKISIGFGESEYCEDIVQQGDAKLVVVGFRSSFTGDSDFAVARLETNGVLDTDDGDGGFDGDGKLTTGFGGDEFGEAVALQEDGKIVVLGNDFSPEKSYIARYKTDGSLDSTFDGDGKLTIPTDYLMDLEILPDGKLLTLGRHHSPDGDYKFALHQLLSNGAPDTSFGVNGIFWPDFGGNDQGKVLALQPDGRILAAGWTNPGGIIIRMWPDTTFDSGGQQAQSLVFPVAYPEGSDAITYASAVQADGKLLVAGELRNPTGTRSDAYISRFLPDGQLDATFGSQGTARLWAGNFNAARAIAIQPDGMIVIGGYSDYGVGWVEFMVARFYPNGAPDSTFGENGNNYRIANFSTTASDDRGYALALAPDGKIVVVGNVWFAARQIWGIARWNNNGTPDSSFGASGRIMVDFIGSNAARAVVVQPDNKIIVGGEFNGDFYLQGLLENGLSDPSFGTNGGTLTNMGGTDSITALALAPNGWIYAAGYSWNGGADDFALTQYRPDGTLAQCQAGQPCTNWPDGKRYVSLGGSDSAYALILRGDDQLVAAGCSDFHMAAVQVSTTDVNAQPILFETDFVGDFDCAFGLTFGSPSHNKIVLAGLQIYNNDRNIALARFETTFDNSASSGNQVYLPVVVR